MNIIPLILDEEGNELRWDLDVDQYQEVPVTLVSVAYCGDWGDGEPRMIMRFQKTAS